VDGKHVTTINLDHDYDLNQSPIEEKILRVFHYYLLGKGYAELDSMCSIYLRRQQHSLKNF